MQGKTATQWLRILAPVLASLAGLATLRLLGRDLIDRQTLHSWLQPLGPWAPAAFLLLLVVRPLTLLPGQLFIAVGGLLFGVVEGSLYALAGTVLSAALVFLLGRTFGTRLMRRFAGENFEALQDTARRHDFKVAAVVTMNPLLPTDLMIAFGGASSARFWPTALGALLGTAPGTFLTAQFGSALGSGKTILVLASAAGMGVSMALGVWLGKRVVSDFDEAARAYRERRHRHFPRFRRTADTRVHTGVDSGA
ncbi:MAG TPA: TVP38/TMEM64 family protein [Myxococcaceae bacterium]|nr:TVP38/TMEM64 family protein [Myxococcaceae bacterium]